MDIGNLPWLVGEAVEANSSQKAKMRKDSYIHILEDSELCLGSYCFLWGYKQEVTPTWYGIFTKDGRGTESIDVLIHTGLKTQ